MSADDRAVKHDSLTNKSKAQTGAPVRATSMDRTVLPVPEPQYPPITELDVHNAQAPPRFQVKAPKGAPNVVVILLDNFGFGDGSTFGGTHPDADAGPIGQDRAALQQFQSPSAVFAQPRGLPYRT